MVSFVNPAITQDSEAEVHVATALPPLAAVKAEAVYVVTSEPPLLSGALQATCADAAALVAWTLTGAPGKVYGVPVIAADPGPGPTPLSARMITL